MPLCRREEGQTTHLNTGLSIPKIMRTYALTNLTGRCRDKEQYCSNPEHCSQQMSDERRSNDVYTRRAITRVITLPEIIIILIDRESTSVTVRNYVHSWTWCSAENTDIIEAVTTRQNPFASITSLELPAGPDDCFVILASANLN